MLELNIRVITAYINSCYVSGFSSNWNSISDMELRIKANGIIILEGNLSAILPAGITTIQVAMTDTTLTYWITVCAWIASGITLEIHSIMKVLNRNYIVLWVIAPIKHIGKIMSLLHKVHTYEVMFLALSRIVVFGTSKISMIGSLIKIRNMSAKQARVEVKVRN